MNYNCFRFLTYNYIDSEILANYSATSESVSNPIENAFNRVRRSKTWRSAGFFKVDNTNNKIIFREVDAGSLITATLAIGEYTSIDAFRSQVQTAMNTAATAAITVTHDNGRFRLASNGSYFSLVCSDVNFTSISILGFNNVDRTGALTYVADEIRCAYPNERIVFDMGVATNPSVFCMTAKRNTPIGISADAVIKIEGNPTNNWDAPAYSQTLVYDDEVISLFSNDGLHTDAMRYWSIKFEDIKSPNLFVEIGSFFLGNYFNPQRGQVQYPWSNKYIDRTETYLSEGGQSFSDVLEQTAEYDVEWLGLQKTDVEEFRNIFEIYGLGRPFWVSMDTEETFSTNKNRRIVFCKFISEPQIKLISPDNFTLSCTIREEL